MVSAVPTYSMFGLRLRSDVELADAEPVAGSAFDCCLHHRPDEAPAGNLEFMGEEKVIGDVRVRSFRTVEGFRLHFDDTGAFDLAAEGREITWWSSGRPADEAVQTDIVGRVLAFVLHMRGIITLHASAVSIAGEGVVFLAPKMFGKSTLAFTLVRRGARLISDDTVAVDLVSPPELRAGIQRLRLWPDVLLASGRSTESAGDKIHVRPDADQVVGVARTPLRAIYLLRPRAGEDARVDVARERFSHAEATLGVIAFRKLGYLLDGPRSAQVLESAGRLVSLVPVYGLDVVRDLTRIETVANAIWSWHTGTRSDVIDAAAAAG